MKLIKISEGGLNQTKDVPGLLTCRVDYEIKNGKGQVDYHGPKFHPVMWHQVLSFFRWTNKEMDSESQVRLYVNTHLGRWGAWAFPQEARTGMNAREIAMPETPAQAMERFASWGSEPSADWLYFCTVHHHCSASAFQSGTDEENEQSQDGLHLTVGRMDADRHELHARFYLGGNCFTADLSRFWPVDPELAEQVPPTMHDELARFQMGEKVVMDFPEAWRKNVIETRQTVRNLDPGGHRRDGNSLRLDVPGWMRADDAFREITDCAAASAISEEQVFVVLQSLAENPAVNLIFEACLKYKVTPDDILAEIQAYETGF